MKKNIILILVLLGFLPAKAQYSNADRIQVAQQFKQYFADEYYLAINRLGEKDLNYDTKKETLNNLIGLCFGNDHSAIVAYDLNPTFSITENSSKTINAYLTDIYELYRDGDFSASNPTLKDISFGKIQVNKAGETYMSIYVNESFEGTYNDGKIIKQVHRQGIKEFWFAFSVNINDQCASVFSKFKIIRIRQATTIPAETIKLTGKEDLVILRNTEKDLSSVLDCFSDKIISKMSKTSKKIGFENFTFETRLIPTDFGNTLSQQLKTIIQRKTGKEVFTITSDAQKADFYIRGGFKQFANNVEIYANVSDSQDRFIHSISNSNLSVDWVRQQKMAFEPANYMNGQEQKVIDAIKNNTVVAKIGDFGIEVQTDKGKQGIEYKADDYMKIFVKATKPCYVRLIYVFEDGTVTLLSGTVDKDYKKILQQDIQILDSQTNQMVELPISPQCGSPFGIEHLIVYAATLPFEPLKNLEENEGYVIVKEALKNTLNTSVRGFKNKGIIVGEKLLITTRATKP